MFSNKFIFWVITFAILGSFFYSIHGVLLPFVIAFLLSYFLNPLVNFLEKRKIARYLATMLVLFSFVLIIILIISVIAPLVRDQVTAFIERIPKYSKFVMEQMVPALHERINSLNPFMAEKIREALQDSTSSFFTYIAYLITDIFKSGFALVNIVSFIFISPVIAFYMLRDWNKAFTKIYNLLPAKHRSLIIAQFRKIDQVISNFIRGQTIVCLFLAVFYSTGLTIIGLDFGLFIGLLTGFLCFVPYIGVLSGTLVSIIIALIQFGTLKGVLSVAVVFAIGQFIEGNFVTPKIVGEKVGLPPVMIFLALFSGGTLFGFVGVLFAIPIAAIIGVIVQFLVSIYKQSSYYKG